jgi:hypothetical protein
MPPPPPPSYGMPSYPVMNGGVGGPPMNGYGGQYMSGPPPVPPPTMMPNHPYSTY